MQDRRRSQSSVHADVSAMLFWQSIHAHPNSASDQSSFYTLSSPSIMHAVEVDLYTKLVLVHLPVGGSG